MRRFGNLTACRFWTCDELGQGARGCFIYVQASALPDGDQELDLLPREALLLPPPTGPLSSYPGLTTQRGESMWSLMIEVSPGESVRSGKLSPQVARTRSGFLLSALPSDPAGGCSDA